MPVAREILHFLAGSEGRVSIPSKELKFKKRDISYKPEVLSFENGRFIKEDGNPYGWKDQYFQCRIPAFDSRTGQGIN